jgi:HlyD family secretion protein
MKIAKFWFYVGLPVIIAGVFFTYSALKPKKPVYNTARVTVGDISQEISESGFANKGEAISLTFKNSGQIAKINVAVGDKAAAGDVLAEIDSFDLKVRLKQAKADHELALIKLEKLRVGAGIEEVNVARAAVSAAQVALDNARQSAGDIKRAADDSMAASIGDALDSLSDASTKAYNAQNFASLLQRTYFIPHESDSIRVFEDSQRVKKAADDIKLVVDGAKIDGSQKNVDLALGSSIKILESAAVNLKDMREICEYLQWRDTVAAADKTTLDSHRDLINASITELTSARQTVAARLVANDFNINTAAAAISSADSRLKSVQAEYEAITAPARGEDVSALNIQVRQAEAQIDLLESQLNDAVLRSPVDGDVIAVNKRAGEIAQPAGGEPVLVILPSNPYAIDVDIYEEDVINLKVGDAAKITLTAFPETAFAGLVASIDPSQKMVNGVVYYRSRIAFMDFPKLLKPGMSADIVIPVVLAKGVNKIPERALQKKDGSYFVQVQDNEVVKETAVTVGARSKIEVEIISGLEEGQEVIIP